MQAVKSTRQLLSRGSAFTGRTGKMLLLYAALCFGTIFSLGIAYPWLSCALYRWEIDNSIISGKRLHFDGKGGDLFKKYIKWLGLMIITLGIYKLWLSRNVFMWKTSHTHFTDEKGGTSCYKCDILDKLFMLIRYYAIIVVTLSLGKGIANCHKTGWTLKHTIIDGAQLDFNGKALDYFLEYLLCVLLTICTIGIYAFFVPVRLKRWEVEHTQCGLAPL